MHYSNAIFSSAFLMYQPLRLIFAMMCLWWSSRRKWSKLSNICFLLKKSTQIWGHCVSNFKGASGTRTPPKWWAKGGDKGEGVRFFPFSIENEKENGKIFCTFCRKSFKDSKTVFFFHSSIKTEEVLLFYIYKYIYIYV